LFSRRARVWAYLAGFSWQKARGGRGPRLQATDGSCRRREERFNWRTQGPIHSRRGLAAKTNTRPVGHCRANVCFHLLERQKFASTARSACLLGRAERSRPKAAQRRAEGAPPLTKPHAMVRLATTLIAVVELSLSSFRVSAPNVQDACWHASPASRPPTRHRCQCTDGLTYRNCYGVNLECL
jgi:hypothetical protein